MCQVTLEIPDAVLYDTRMSVSDTVGFARQALALLYYRRRGVSIGYCAEIAGMTEADFLLFLGEEGVSIFDSLSAEELAADVENALRVAVATHDE